MGLKAGAELDREMAVKVMQWHQETDHDYNPPQVDWFDAEGNFQAHVNCEGQLEGLLLWSPSESIAHAVQVEDRIAELGLISKYVLALQHIGDMSTPARVITDNGRLWRMAHATAGQRCLAALATVEEK